MRQIRCAEIWGGIQVVNLDVCTRGLTASIHSTASGGERGGDIYYFSVCSTDKLTRIAVADVRGHGEQVSNLSRWLYDSLQERMNTLDGAGVLADLNTLVNDHGFDAITTAAVVSYYSGDSRLFFSYAGHPPILVRQGAGAWMAMPLDSGAPGHANLPLGVLRDVRYDQAELHLKPGDRVFLCTDGLAECPDPSGNFYGDEKLMNVLESCGGLSIAQVKDAVFESLAQHAAGPLLHDDCTLMVIEVREPQAADPGVSPPK